MSDFKKYVIHISSNKLSYESALKTIDSAKNIGKIDVELWEGIHRDDSLKLNKKYKFNFIDENRLWTNIGYKESILGCFFSHFHLWNHCVKLDQKIMVLEHDAIFTNEFKDYDFDGVINYGKPSWEKDYKQDDFDFELIHKKRNRKGLYKRWCDCTVEKGEECYCREYCLLGAHCYTITPTAATKLIQKSSEQGIVPADLHINRKNIDIADVYPFCSRSISTFSLIQKRTELQSWYKDKSFQCGDGAWDEL